MEIHHDRHHAAYVNNLNGVMTPQPDLAIPRNYIVSHQNNVEVAIHYRRRLRNRGIRSGKAKPRTQCLVCSALD
jgi:superoxide dismutase